MLKVKRNEQEFLSSVYIFPEVGRIFFFNYLVFEVCFGHLRVNKWSHCLQEKCLNFFLVFEPRKNTFQNLLRIELSEKRVRKGKRIKLTGVYWSKTLPDWSPISPIACEWGFVHCHDNFFGKDLIWCLDPLSCPFPVTSSSGRITFGDMHPSLLILRTSSIFVLKARKLLFHIDSLSTFLLLLSQSWWCGPCLILHRCVNFHLSENCYWDEIWWSRGWSFLLGPKKQTI